MLNIYLLNDNSNLLLAIYPRGKKKKQNYVHAKAAYKQMFVAALFIVAKNCQEMKE